MKRDIFCKSVGGVDALAAQGRAQRLLAHTRKIVIPRIGAMKGKLALPENLDSPLPDAMLDAFDGTQA
ncbi:type II toxin-antitoxin system prevent-host-death family antitoxin [Pseudomonas sp. McL0111]|uniref:type II toxin-antitoxin system prevent-host-death family antitoxin n=1 Tax=Pseudomonas sp. McL0111 TaxID=3457357 RepID=UPI00403ED338